MQRECLPLAEDIIKIDYTAGFYGHSSDALQLARLPEIQTTITPIELQSVIFSLNNVGTRCTYSLRGFTSLSFYSDKPPRRNLHRHNYFELIFVESETFEMQIESQIIVLGRGDVCILNRSTRHAEVFDREVHLKYLVLSPEYLRSWPSEEGISLHAFDKLHFFLGKGLSEIYSHNKDYLLFKCKTPASYHQIKKNVSDLQYELENQKAGYSLFVRGIVYRLLADLSNKQLYEATHIDLGASVNHELAITTKKIIDTSKSKVSKDLLAKKLNYSIAHLDRVFKLHWGYSISEYSRIVCLQVAAEKIRNSKAPIQEIIRLSGYSNRTSFNKQFYQLYHCTPSEYRKRNKSI